jgi:apolipoprotein N-acyltransferase
MNRENPSIYPQSDRWSYLWLVIGAASMVFTAGNWPLSLAAWLGPLFMLRFMRTQNLLRGFLLSAVGVGIAYMIAFQGSASPGIMPLPLFGTLLGLMYGLLFLVDRLLVSRLPGQGPASFLATLVFPCLMTGYELLWFNKLIFGSSGSWAYSQQSSLILMQMISITGLWGLTFITAWFASTVNWARERGFSWSGIRGGALTYTSILLLVLAFGSLRLRFSAPPAGTVRVHGVATVGHTASDLYSKLIPLLNTDREAYRQLATSNYDVVIEAINREARAGAQIIALPETAAAGVQEDLDALTARIAQAAKSGKAYVALGMVVLDTGGMEPRLLIIDPLGEVVLNHLKYAYGMGTPISQVDLQTVDTPFGRLSGVLCGDLDNPGVVSQAGRKEVDILLVPATEIPGSGQWHARMAALRSIENGFSMVRPTVEGISTAIDPYGRILASVDYFKAGDRTFVAQVPTHRVGTIYSSIGNLFGWLSVSGFVILAGWAIVRVLRPRRPATVLPEAEAHSAF